MAKSVQPELANDPQVLNFLRQVEPIMVEQLEANQRTQAFEGYDVNWEEERDSVTDHHTLYLPAALVPGGALDTTIEMDCTALAWNCNGFTLAVGYGSHAHEASCTHRSMVCCWNVAKTIVNSHHPDVMLETQNCVTSVAWHPTIPSVIAAATFSGTIYCWDTAKADVDPLLAVSSAGANSHREPVTALGWSFDNLEREHQLVSLGSDGLVLHWSLKTNLSAPFASYSLLPNRAARVSLRNLPPANRKKILGGIAMSLSKQEKSTLVVGTEAGALFKCFLSGGPDSKIGAEGKPPKLVSPISFGFSPHAGPVHSVDCSPFHRNVFVSCSSDSTTRLHSMLQPEPILSLEPSQGYLYSVSFSRFRPLVFGTACADGFVYLYDIDESKLKPVVRLLVKEEQPVFAVAFNPAQRELVAAGAQGGLVKVWQLSHHLCNMTATESATLTRIAQPKESMTAAQD